MSKGQDAGNQSAVHSEGEEIAPIPLIPFSPGKT
jgi:hypothetical protein